MVTLLIIILILFTLSMICANIELNNDIKAANKENEIDYKAELSKLARDMQ